MVHILGVLGSISGPHCWVNKWSTSFRSIKTVFQRIVVNQNFKKGVAKIAFSIVFFFFLVVVGGCYY